MQALSARLYTSLLRKSPPSPPTWLRRSLRGGWGLSPQINGQKYISTSLRTAKTSQISSTRHPDPIMLPESEARPLFEARPKPSPIPSCLDPFN